MTQWSGSGSGTGARGSGKDDDGVTGSDTSGPDHGDAGPEKSAVLCYTVLNAATPEAPSTILFPLVGLAVVGGGVLLARRPRARAKLEPPT